MALKSNFYMLWQSRMPLRQLSAEKFIVSDPLPWSIQPDGGVVKNRWDNMHLPWSCRHTSVAVRSNSSILYSDLIGSSGGCRCWFISIEQVTPFPSKQCCASARQSHCSQIHLKNLKTKPSILRALFSPQLQWICTGMSSIKMMRISLEC